MIFEIYDIIYIVLFMILLLYIIMILLNIKNNWKKPKHSTGDDYLQNHGTFT